jgi:tRNA 5-methylaminomethyl-2-thiouridine biosynthesis bifunctional protein
MARLPERPALTWENDTPRATAFGDVYSSRAGGLEEARAVFHVGCGLPDAWSGRARFAIGELGFGSGLNALATWEVWARTRPPGATLHFVSVEAFPLSHEDAARTLSAYPELATCAARLLANWPVRAFGPQRFWFPEDGFALTVLVGEAHAALRELDGVFDAWFLDGFSPARNPAMWAPEVMAEIARLSAPGACAASYSVAAPVRQALEAAGFEPERRPGFADKRQRLEARQTKAPPRSHSIYPRAAPQHAERVAVVGGGIAGCAVVAALARRGVIATLFDPDPQSAASAGPAALVMPRLERTDTPLARLYLAAYLYALPFYAALGAFSTIGVEQRPGQDREAETFAAIAADPPLPSDWLRRQGEGLLHPRAGVVDTPAALAALIAGARRRREEVLAFERVGEAWLLRGRDGILMEADAVVLANGPGLGKFAQTAFLPLRYSRGQLDWAPLTGPAPEHAIAAGGYLAALGDKLMFGATFDRSAPDAPMAPSAESSEDNFATLLDLAPDLAARIDCGAVQARAALRVSTPDVAPVAGLLPDAPAWRVRYEALRTGAPLDLSAPPPAQEGLYVLGALSARGFLLAPLLAESIVSEILGEPSPLEAAARHAAHPARFLVRALKRGEALTP